MLPQNISFSYIFSQIIGLVALSIIVVGYFCKTRDKFFLSQFVGNVFISISFLFLGAYFACIGVSIACIRSGTFYLFESRKKDTPLYLIVVFCALTLIGAIFFWNDLWNVFPLIALLGYTIAFAIKDMQTMRIILLVCCLCFLIFNLVKFAYSDAITKVFEMTTISMALFKYSHKSNPISE